MGCNGAQSRNTAEAAAFLAIGTAVQPVTMQDHRRGEAVTEYTLAVQSTCGRHHTAILRRDFAGGHLRGILAAQPLHPWLHALRTLHIRHCALDMLRGHAWHLVQDAAPGAWLLERGTGPAVPIGPVTTTGDFDRWVSLMACGCAPLRITGSDGQRLFTVSRVALPTLPGAPGADSAPWMQSLESGTLFTAPQVQWPFAISLHALHCQRELLRSRHSNQFITVRHRTLTTRGAAISTTAPGRTFDRVRRQLGVRVK